MSDIIIREVVKDVWTFSRPFSRFGIMPVGGRSTAIKLKSGDVWVMASTPLCAETKKTLSQLGPVKYVVGADIEHHLFLAEFHKAYPDAKLVSVEEVVDKKKHEGLKFHGHWGDSSQDPKFGFEDEIQSCYFSGFKNKDVAFCHQASKTLVVADLLFNFPAKEQYSKSWFPSNPLANFLHPYSTLHQRMVWTLGLDREAMKRDVRTVAGWDFEKVIPCHGDVIEQDGNKAWRQAYKYYFD